MIVQSNTGKLFNVDADTGVTDEIDLGGGSVPAGDGILLDGGRRLWVVQNAFNQVALVDLNSGLTAGEIVATRGADDGLDFETPTTVAEQGNRLLVVNARFNEAPEPTPETEYWVTQLDKFGG